MRVVGVGSPTNARPDTSMSHVVSSNNVAFGNLPMSRVQRNYPEPPAGVKTRSNNFTTKRYASMGSEKGKSKKSMKQRKS